MLNSLQLRVMWTLVLLLLCLVASRMASAHTFHRITDEYTLKRLAIAKEWRHHIPRGWLVSICEQESYWQPSATSSAGAIGVCQLMPDTFERLIKLVQGEHGLQQDGILGPRTWAALYPDEKFPGYRSLRQWLYIPRINLEFAARYVNWLRTTYSTESSLVFALYYASPRHDVLRYILQTQARLGRILDDLDR